MSSRQVTADAGTPRPRDAGRVEERPSSPAGAGPATEKTGKPIHVSTGADQIAFTPDGKTTYVGTSAGRITGVVPISTATKTAGKPILAGESVAIGIAPDGKTLYAAALAPDGKTPHVADRVKIVPISIAPTTRQADPHVDPRQFPERDRALMEASRAGWMATS